MSERPLWSYLVASELSENQVLLSVVSPAGVNEVGTVDVAASFYLAVHQELPVAYLTSGAEGGSVVAVALSGEGVGPVTRVTAVGEFPCHLAPSPDGLTLATANYVGGSVAFIDLVDRFPVQVRSVVPIPYETRTGVEERQDAAYPHHVLWRADGTVLVTDLGGDAVWSVDPASGAVKVEYAFAARSGPRHLAADQSGRLWASLELSNEVGLVTRSGVEVAPASTAASEVRNYPGDLVAAGPWMVLANRGDDTIAVYEGAAEAPSLVGEVPCGGVWPAALASDGDSLAVAHRDSDSVAVFPLAPAGLGNPAIHPLTRPFAVAALPPHNKAD